MHLVVQLIHLVTPFHPTYTLGYTDSFHFHTYLHTTRFELPSTNSLYMYRVSRVLVSIHASVFARVYARLDFRTDSARLGDRWRLDDVNQKHILQKMTASCSLFSTLYTGPKSTSCRKRQPAVRYFRPYILNQKHIPQKLTASCLSFVLSGSNLSAWPLLGSR